PLDTTLVTPIAVRLLLIALRTILVFLLLEFPAFINMLYYRALIGTGPRWWFTATYFKDPELGHVHSPHSHLSGGASGGALAVGYDIPPSNLTRYRWDV